MEEAFMRVVHRIFDNWTALKLAAMYCERPQSQTIVTDFKNYIVQYCIYTPNIDESTIEEALDDIMDQEFETICEDDSTKEIAKILYSFYNLLKQEDLVKFEEEYQKLPASSAPILNSSIKNERIIEDESDSESEDPNETNNTMETDSEWIEVKSRKKR